MKPLSHPAAWLVGYLPDLPTPFDDNDELDLTAFARLCERQIDAGVPAIVVGETTGEGSTLTRWPPDQSEDSQACSSSNLRAIDLREPRTDIATSVGVRRDGRRVRSTQTANASRYSATNEVVLVPGS